MAAILPCDVIVSSLIPEQQLLVVETNPGRLQAGTIVVRDQLEVVTLPGTYLAEQLDKTTKVEEWDCERAAKALTLALFDAESALHATYLAIWRNSLSQARASNQPFELG